MLVSVVWIVHVVFVCVLGMFVCAVYLWFCMFVFVFIELCVCVCVFVFVCIEWCV